MLSVIFPQYMWKTDAACQDPGSQSVFPNDFTTEKLDGLPKVTAILLSEFRGSDQEGHGEKLLWHSHAHKKKTCRNS